MYTLSILRVDTLNYATRQMQLLNEIRVFMLITRVRPSTLSRLAILSESLIGYTSR